MDYTRSEAKAAARERFRGLWAATTTPFDDAGRLDESGLAADMDRLTGGSHHPDGPRPARAGPSFRLILNRSATSRTVSVK
jgi:hypothetical protein